MTRRSRCASCGAPSFRCLCELRDRIRLVAAEHVAAERVIHVARALTEARPADDEDLVLLAEAIAEYDRAVEERAA